jgi:hypothetical protein
MVACRDIEPDEDLLLSYGKLDNTLLLLDYGELVLLLVPTCLRLKAIIWIPFFQQRGPSMT